MQVLNPPFVTPVADYQLHQTTTQLNQVDDTLTGGSTPQTTNPSSSTILLGPTGSINNCGMQLIEDLIETFKLQIKKKRL